MMDFLRDALKFKLNSKLQEKDPYHHHIWDVAYLIGMDTIIWPTYPENFCPNFFSGKSMAQKYPTYLQFGHMSKLSQFFLGPFP